MVTTEHLCLVQYFCVRDRAILWHMFTTSTNSVTLSRQAPYSSAKLWLIWVSHGAVPSSRAFCLSSSSWHLRDVVVCVLGTAPSERVRELHCRWKQESRNSGSGVKEEGPVKLLILLILLQFLSDADYCMVLIIVAQFEILQLRTVASQLIQDDYAPTADECTQTTSLLVLDWYSCSFLQLCFRSPAESIVTFVLFS